VTRGPQRADPTATGRWGRSQRRHRVQRPADKAIVPFSVTRHSIGQGAKRPAPTATPARLRLRPTSAVPTRSRHRIQANPSALRLPNGTSIGVRIQEGDRVPPGGTFTYTLATFGWPTTAGVWLYHDHSIATWRTSNKARSAIVVIEIRRTRRHQILTSRWIVQRAAHDSLDASVSISVPSCPTTSTLWAARERTSLTRRTPAPTGSGPPQLMPNQQG